MLHPHCPNLGVVVIFHHEGSILTSLFGYKFCFLPVTFCVCVCVCVCMCVCVGGRGGSSMPIPVDQKYRPQCLQMKTEIVGERNLFREEEQQLRLGSHLINVCWYICTCMSFEALFRVRLTC